MQFSRTTIIAGMKMAMTKEEKAKTQDINLAIALCLDDISTHLQSRSFLLSYEESVAASDRTVTLNGEAYDLRTIFALKYGTGESQKPLEYVDPKVFLAKYDNPSAVAEVPDYYTILSATDGYPIVKFNVPATVSTTLTVYYFAEVTEDNMFQARSATAIIAGSIAWFHGIATERGAGYYARFRELLQSMQVGDTYLPKEPLKFIRSLVDQSIYSVMRRISSRRS